MAVKKWIGGFAGATTDVNTAGNYVPSGVPVAGDDLFIEANPSGTDYGMTNSLSTLASVILNSLNISQTYTGQIGTNSTTSSSAYLQVGATTTNIGYQFGGTIPGSGSSLIRINNGTNQNATNIFNTAQSSALTNAGPVTLLGTHTSNTLNITAGIVSIAQDPAESSAYATVNTGGTVFFGTGVTLTTLNVIAGSCLIRSASTTVNITSGAFTTAGTGGITTINAYGGGAILNATGTIGNLNIFAASVDMSQSTLSRTLTNATVNNGANFNFNNGVKGSIVFSNGLTVKASSGQYSIVPWPSTNLAFS